jgi:hypothetical protein
LKEEELEQEKDKEEIFKKSLMVNKILEDEMEA